MGFFVGFPVLQPALGKDAPVSESQFLQQVEMALKTKNKEAFRELYSQADVSSRAEFLDGQMIDDLLTRDVKKVKLSPLPPGFSATGQSGNVRFHLNVQPVGMLEMGFTDGFGVAFAYGRKGDVYYIASVIEETVDPAEPGTNQWTIRVQTPDGKPQPNVTVVSANSASVPRLHFKMLYGGSAEYLTDEQGEFNLPLTDTNDFLVASSDQGFGWLPRRGLTNQAVMLMRPWGHIAGVLKNRNQFMVEEPLKVSQDRFYDGDDGPEIIPLTGLETRTDEVGRFVFDLVPPIPVCIDWLDQRTGDWRHLWFTEGKPGETEKLEINTRGRTVVGRLALAPGLNTNVDLSSGSGALVSVMKGREGSRRSVGFPFLSNGSFCADRVEPGDYQMTGGLVENGEQFAFVDPTSIHVPDDTSDAADVPLDVGIILLKPDLTTGDIAPDFARSTLDGTPLNLSDFRGKYVLLDFWATWCGPCVAETPNMKATYDAFGKDARFVMISMSLDSDPAAPKKFARNHDIAWTQGFLGEWSKDPVTRSYGVFGIPSIFLIGPDGRILAADLRGTNIEKAVAAALTRPISDRK